MKSSNIESTTSLKKTGCRSTVQSSHEYLLTNESKRRLSHSIKSNKEEIKSPKAFEIMTLNGRSRRKVGNKFNKESHEEIKYGHKRQLTNFNSNSMRTIIPNLMTEVERPLRIRTAAVKESKEFAYISNVDVESPRRKLNEKYHQSQCFIYKQNPSRPNCLKKCKSQFEKYSTTTQIINLPGGIKRESSDIKDDSNLLLKRNQSSISFRRKIKNDVNSHVTCLNGFILNTDYNQRRKFSGKKNQSSSVFEKNALKENKSESKKKYRAAGLFRKINEGKGKKFINLKEWKNDYYSKLKKLFNHPKNENIKRKPYGIYKNQSQLDYPI